MSILKASNFAAKMLKENQHTLYRCCRIAADYYGVSATDVQKELASRGGQKSKGRTPKNKGLELKKYNVKGNVCFYTDYCDDFWSENVDINVSAYSKKDAYEKARKALLKKKSKGVNMLNPTHENYDEIVFEYLDNKERLVLK
jgi:hypothetical protein